MSRSRQHEISSNRGAAAYLPDVAALLPVAGDAVPLLRRGGQNVGRGECARVRRRISGELLEREAEPFDEFRRPVIESLAHERLERRDVHGLHAGVRSEQTEHLWGRVERRGEHLHAGRGALGADGAPRARR